MTTAKTVRLDRPTAAHLLHLVEEMREAARAESEANGALSRTSYPESMGEPFKEWTATFNRLTRAQTALETAIKRTAGMDGYGDAVGDETGVEKSVPNLLTPPRRGR